MFIQAHIAVDDNVSLRPPTHTHTHTHTQDNVCITKFLLR
jgi:hypothetical protein